MQVPNGDLGDFSHRRTSNTIGKRDNLVRHRNPLGGYFKLNSDSSLIRNNAVGGFLVCDWKRQLQGIQLW